MKKIAEFETLYEECRCTVEYFINCRVSNYHDAQDVLQTVLISAFQSFSRLSDIKNFSKWILAIASHKIKDYYGEKAKHNHLPIDYADVHSESCFAKHDIKIDVNNTLEKLPEKEKQILYQYYIRDISQEEIAGMLKIPIGTVKSRLNTAKKHFAAKYNSIREVEKNMKTIFPKFIPDYKIIKVNEPIFDVVCEEVPGWLVVPRVGEKCRFAFYDEPTGVLTDVYSMETVRNAVVHDVECVQISIEETDQAGETEKHDLFVRMTENYCMYIAEMRIRNEALEFSSFMDADWREKYEIGENNCGRKLHQTALGEAKIDLDGVVSVSESMIKAEAYDLIGRYNIEIAEKTYETVAMVQLTDDGIFVMQYLDKNGRTVLFRRFNRYDWKLERYSKSWLELLPDSERLIVNGEAFVHWYDCIPDRMISAR